MGLDAFVARVILIEMADRSLDLQYYIFNHDSSGALIIDRLIAAADRGVRVRLLLDDWGTIARRNATITALDAHPNVEIRLFNPYIRPGSIRRLRDMGNRFSRINRRMHNKMLLADGTAVVLGGRNIGDEYFGQATVNFQDLDVIGLGPIARESAESFEAYWNSGFAVPVVEFQKHAEDREIVVRARKRKLFGTVDSTIYVHALEESELAMELRRSQVRLHWASGSLLYDPPEKLAAPFERASDKYLGAQLTRIAAAVESELLVVSPYFVPGKGGVQFFGGKKASGVDVRILTNSLAATDAWLVHAAYKKYRRPLLRKSVRIYELKPEARADSGVKGSVGTSRSSLHGKTLVFDRTSVFIGSLNIDPRSLRQNTECGVLVGDKELAGDVAALFELWSSPDYAYELVLERAPHRHRLAWMTNEGGSSVRYHREPGAGMLRRMGVNIAALFPIESQV